MHFVFSLTVFSIFPLVSSASEEKCVSTWAGLIGSTSTESLGVPDRPGILAEVISSVILVMTDLLGVKMCLDEGGVLEL